MEGEDGASRGQEGVGSSGSKAGGVVRWAGPAELGWRGLQVVLGKGVGCEWAGSAS